MKGEFNRARQEFGKYLRQARRQYQYEKQDQMIKARDSDIISFWRKIDRVKILLASDRNQRIEVVENGEIITDINQI